MTQVFVVRPRLLVAGLVLIVSCWIASPPAKAFECPTPQDAASPGVLKESSDHTREMANLLATGDMNNRVPVVIADLRKRYPAVTNAEVENYLVTAYCPAVARLTGLTDAQKRLRVERFAARVRQTIYADAAGRGHSS